MKKEAFISYSSKDTEIAHEIFKAIEDCGITVWIAPDCIPIGANYGGAIDLAIEECSIMVVVYSNACNASEHVANEIDTAFNEGKLIIPFCIDDSPMSRNLRYYLRRKQHLNAFPNYKVHIQKLLDTLCSALGRSHMDATNNQAQTQVSSLSSGIPESNVSITKVGYNGNKRQSKKTSKSVMDRVVTWMDEWSNQNKEEDKDSIFSFFRESSKAYDIPKSLSFDFDGRKFYMILSEDESFYIGNINAQDDDLNWLDNKWVDTVGSVALCAGAAVASFSTLLAAPLVLFGLVSLGKKATNTDDKENLGSSNIKVDKKLCNNLSEQTGYKFRLPRKNELKGVKSYAIPSCIILRLKDNPNLLTRIETKGSNS